MPDVIVIGAGVAGLRTAVELAARGAQVLVLESKAVLGGRATAFSDPQTGERVDNGQHVLVGCYEETFAFLRQLGTEDRVLAAAKSGCRVRRSHRREEPSSIAAAAGAVQSSRWALRLGGAGVARSAAALNMLVRSGSRKQGCGQRPEG